MSHDGKTSVSTYKRHFYLVGLCALLLSASLPALAQKDGRYPSKPIRIVVVHAPGGIADIVGRLAGQKLSERLGQPVVVENRTGAAGMIGSEYVARANRDGYTLMVGTVGTHAINASLYPEIKYDNLKDFAAISLLTSQPLMLAVHTSVAASTVPELIRLLKANPGKYSFGSAGGAGTSSHLAAELLKIRADVAMVHIPYKGSGPMIIDLVGGHINLAFDNLPTAYAQVKIGKLKGLAVTSLERSPLLPEMATVSEFIPGFQVTSWQGIFAPAGVPVSVQETLSRELREIMRLPDVVSRMLDIGVTPIGSDRKEFTAFVADETKRWKAVVKVSGATANN